MINSNYQGDIICWQYNDPGVYYVLHEFLAGPTSNGTIFQNDTVMWSLPIYVYDVPWTPPPALYLCGFQRTWVVCIAASPN